MAQRVLVELLDDLDQSPAASTITFGLDGRTYTIDLNESHAAEWRGFLATYIEAGRKVSARRRATQSSKQAYDFDPAAVRAWADSNGIEISKRGRVPSWVVEKYHAAGY
ncbi:MAG: Lsr2 family protein [Bifidobacteriaceae bacterium]|jgi:hypothetical protein|nr:Lsr2 family protein [Bifidobacteriaceae bacterium]